MLVIGKQNPANYCGLKRCTMLYQIHQVNSPFLTSYFNKLSPMPHIHSHLELIYMEEGASIVSLDNENYLIEKGDLFLSFPNQIHAYHDCCTVEGYLFIFSSDLFKDFKKLFQTQIPTSPIIKCSQLPKDICNLLMSIRNRNLSECTFKKISAKGDLLSLLAEILSQMTFENSPTANDSVKSILAYCSENYTQPLTLELLSKELHINKFWISHIFNERLKISFTDFINNLRIEHACTLLERGSAITDVAYASGFSSVRTFNRVFSQRMTMSPTAYIKSKKK